MSTSKLAPFSLCSCKVAPPPENAKLLIFFLMLLGVSFKNIAELGSLALIFPDNPCKAGKNLLNNICFSKIKIFKSINEILWMNRSWFGLFQFYANVSRHSEIGILIYSLKKVIYMFIQIKSLSLYLRNQTHDILSFSENMRETWSNWRSCLNSWVGDFSTVVAFHQTEKTFNLFKFVFVFVFYNENLWNVHLTVCDISLETTDVFVHDIHVLSVNEDEGSFGVEAASDDILDIVITVFSVDLLFAH